ncbi:MAG: aspartate aminotransferase family protein [Clostridiales Family XIII bacterium]|jgi:acetylornithine/N-succinyldiaminopimelate aminotransferase|nr:aspartate aminotransferase family protein [Clostridiales Family XIII bacterium]
MKHEELKKLDQDTILGTYARNDVSLVWGRGAVCRSEDGKRYIDFTSGIGVNALGFSDPQWAEAVGRQAAALQHTSNLYYTEPCALLAERLTARTGLSKVFFCNSGAEANEGAIKAARKYGFEKRGILRPEIITLENSFHGRTMATVSATGQNVFHKFFAPFLEGFAYVPADDTARLRAAVTADTCAVIIETVQGEGGVVALDAAFVRDIAALCAKRDLLFIIDEVQTGVGRTGKFYAYEHFGVRPDIVTTAKALGGGLPIGAILFGEKCDAVLGPGEHGSTFGGNPVACAGGLVILDRIDEPFLEEVRRKAAYITEALAKLPSVRSVSGLGLMIGVELAEKNAKEVVAACAKRGLLILTAKEKLRLLPPLNIGAEETEEGLFILREVLES